MLLTSVIGYTTLLLEERSGPLVAEQRSQLEVVAYASGQMMRVMNNALDVHLCRKNLLVGRLETFDLCELAKVATELFRHECDAAGLWLGHRDCKVSLVTADRAHVFQVMVNLLSNAVAFTEAGGVDVTVETRDGMAVVSVRDTGRGIDPHDRSRIFREFVTVGKPVRGPCGAGLGLAISRTLARSMGGRIEVQSEVGRGSTFRFVLPLAAQG